MALVLHSYPLLLTFRAVIAFDKIHVTLETIRSSLWVNQPQNRSITVPAVNCTVPLDVDLSITPASSAESPNASIKNTSWNILKEILYAEPRIPCQYKVMSQNSSNCLRWITSFLEGSSYGVYLIRRDHKHFSTANNLWDPWERLRSIPWRLWTQQPSNNFHEMKNGIIILRCDSFLRHYAAIELVRWRWLIWKSIQILKMVFGAQS